LAKTDKNFWTFSLIFCAKTDYTIFAKKSKIRQRFVKSKNDFNIFGHNCLQNNKKRIKKLIVFAYSSFS